jgi:putative endonuclease
LLCADGSYYVGSTRGSLESRLAQHDTGTLGGYTARRRPVTLIFHQEFERITDAIAAERQVKAWSRAKKEALMRGASRNASQACQRATLTPQTCRAPFDRRLTAPLNTYAGRH